MTVRPFDNPPLAAVRFPAGPPMMLMLCFCGMMIGLTLDLQSVLPATIISLCLGSHSFVGTVIGHSTLLPATSVLMFVSGFAVLGLGDLVGSGQPGPGRRNSMRFGAVIGCNVAMLVGMFLGEWLGPPLAGGLGLSWNLACMIAAMTVGMSLGMALWTGLTAGGSVFVRRVNWPQGFDAYGRPGRNAAVPSFKDIGNPSDGVKLGPSIHMSTSVMPVETSAPGTSAPGLQTQDQRQGRALHPDRAPRMGLHLYPTSDRRTKGLP